MLPQWKFCARIYELGHTLVIGGWPYCSSTEDKLVKPHVQKDNMFSLLDSTLFHMAGNIISPSFRFFGLQIKGGFARVESIVWGINVQTSQHIDIGQGGCHRPVAEKEGIQGVRPKI